MQSAGLAAPLPLAEGIRLASQPVPLTYLSSARPQLPDRPSWRPSFALQHKFAVLSLQASVQLRFPFPPPWPPSLVPQHPFPVAPTAAPLGAPFPVRHAP